MISKTAQADRSRTARPLLAGDLSLFGEEEGGTSVVDEIRLVQARCAPFRRAPSRLERRHVIEPEFRHSIEIGWGHLWRERNRVALDESPQPRDPPPNWSVHFAPVSRELVETHPRSPGYAVNKLDDG